MRWLIPAGLILCATWAGGCDLFHQNRADRERPQLRLLLGSLHHVEVNGVSHRCATSIRTAILTVDGREFREDVSRDTVIFEVDGLRQGTVRASAAILSNTGDTLFTGVDRRTISASDFGTIDITLEKRLPVLQVCPGSVTLSADQDYTATLEVINRGTQATGTHADTMAWSVETPRVCEGSSCISFQPFSGTTFVGSPDAVFAWWSQPGPASSLGVRFDAPYGWAEVNIRILEE